MSFAERWLYNTALTRPSFVYDEEKTRLARIAEYNRAVRRFAYELQAKAKLAEIEHKLRQQAS